MQEHLDTRLFNTYESLASGLTILADLRNVPKLDDKKDEFIYQDGQVNPDLTPDLSISEVRSRRLGFVALKDSLARSSNIDPVIAEAYLPLVDDGISSCDLLSAAHMGDVDKYRQHNEELYGELNPEIFSFSLDFLRLLIESNRNSRNIFVRDAARQADAVLPNATCDVQTLWPNQRQFKSVKNLFSGFYDEMFDGIKIPETVTSNDAIELIQRVMDNIGLEGYKVVMRKNKNINTLATVVGNKEVRVPQDQEYERKRFIGITSHEVGIHARESQNGREQNLLLLSKGLSKFIFAGEGKGVLVEQLAYSKMAEFMETRRFVDLLRRYLAIGLSVGLDGNGERTFKEVFEIVNAVDRLWELVQDQKHPVEAGARAIDRTWELLAERTNKGPVGKGSAHLKDKVYLEGNLRQWGLLLDQPEMFSYLNLGKYDLTQQSHVKILRGIGILPRRISRLLLSTL